MAFYRGVEKNSIFVTKLKIFVLMLARLLTIALLVISFKMGAAPPTEKIIPFKLGDEIIYLKIYTSPGHHQVFLHLHENEFTSLDAGMQILEKFGGKLVTIAHSTDGTRHRNIVFRHGKQTFQFDPNRIFTNNAEVLKKTIKIVKGKDVLPEEVVSMVQRLADLIWSEIRSYDMIIALHNNINKPAEVSRRWLFWTRYEPESYSIKSYIKSHDIQDDNNSSCSDVYVNAALNNSEFFIVTQLQDFEMLRLHRCSVVLQNANPVDDGSMSVFAAAHQKRYFNSEAKHGKLDAQLEMIEVLMNALYQP